MTEKRESPVETTEPVLDMLKHANVNIPNWNDYFLGLAYVVSCRSKDAQTKCGCVIVNEDNHIVGTGYNSFPRGRRDHLLPNTRPAKYIHMLHSEINAITNSSTSCKGCRAYVTSQPCFNCLMNMWQAGIKHVYTVRGQRAAMINEEELALIKSFLSDTGMRITFLAPNFKWIQELSTKLDAL